MTDNEIKKALKKILELMCNEGDLQRSAIISKSLDLINRLQRENEKNENIIRLADKTIETQKAEIERLQKENHCFADIGKMYSEIKAEAVKETLEKVKKLWGMYRGYDFEIKLDNLLKERVGEDNAVL